MTAHTLASALLVAFSFTGILWVMGLVRLAPERLWPAHEARPAGDRLNLLVWLAFMVAQLAAVPALGGVTVLAVNAAGGGLIVLPSGGWSLVWGFVLYVLVVDLGEYAFHRVQHAIPAMWAMHSLHHSDPHFDSTTAVRHFWAEPVIKSLTIGLLAGLLFKASPAVIGLYTALSFYNAVIHSNTRLDFGRATWLLNSPAYHRLHHSILPEHWDCNFAALLPIWDVIFATYHRPRPDERPHTGLDTGEAPQSPTEALLWPVRNLLKRPSKGLVA